MQSQLKPKQRFPKEHANTTIPRIEVLIRQLNMMRSKHLCNVSARLMFLLIVIILQFITTVLLCVD